MLYRIFVQVFLLIQEYLFYGFAGYCVPCSLHVICFLSSWLFGSAHRSSTFREFLVNVKRVKGIQNTFILIRFLLLASLKHPCCSSLYVCFFWSKKEIRWYVCAVCASLKRPSTISLHSLIDNKIIYLLF